MAAVGARSIILRVTPTLQLNRMQLFGTIGIMRHRSPPFAGRGRLGGVSRKVKIASLALSAHLSVSFFAAGTRRLGIELPLVATYARATGADFGRAILVDFACYPRYVAEMGGKAFAVGPERQPSRARHWLANASRRGDEEPLRRALAALGAALGAPAGCARLVEFCGGEGREVRAWRCGR